MIDDAGDFVGEIGLGDPVLLDFLGYSDIQIFIYIYVNIFIQKHIYIIHGLTLDSVDGVLLGVVSEELLDVDLQAPHQSVRLFPRNKLF